MASATFIDLPLENWPAGTQIYSLSEPFNGNDAVAITKQATGTLVIPATAEGANVPDPNGMGFIAHRTWYPPISHEQALADIGYSIEPMEAL